MHILHLEDDQFLSEIFSVGIRSVNPQINISHFVNSDEALQYIQSNYQGIRVYVLDIRVLGSMNGVELASKVREFDPETPMFITSAYRKPSNDILKELDCQWMAKPWHLVNASHVILPLVQGTETVIDEEDPTVHTRTINDDILQDILQLETIATEYKIDVDNDYSSEIRGTSNTILLFIATKSEPIKVNASKPIRLGRRNEKFVPTVDFSHYRGSDFGVSRFHAEITREGRQFYIKDIGSTNGTWINNSLITAYTPKPLNSGDQIRLGQLNMIFHTTQ